MVAISSAGRTPPDAHVPHCELLTVSGSSRRRDGSSRFFLSLRLQDGLATEDGWFSADRRRVPMSVAGL